MFVLNIMIFNDFCLGTAFTKESVHMRPWNYVLEQSCVSFVLFWKLCFHPNLWIKLNHPCELFVVHRGIYLVNVFPVVYAQKKMYLPQFSPYVFYTCFVFLRILPIFTQYPKMHIKIWSIANGATLTFSSCIVSSVLFSLALSRSTSRASV